MNYLVYIFLVFQFNQCLALANETNSSNDDFYIDLEFSLNDLGLVERINQILFAPNSTDQSQSIDYPIINQINSTSFFSTINKNTKKSSSNLKHFSFFYYSY